MLWLPAGAMTTMSCEIPAEVLRYIELVEADTPRACPEQHARARADSSAPQPPG